MTQSGHRPFSRSNRVCARSRSGKSMSRPHVCMGSTTLLATASRCCAAKSLARSIRAQLPQDSALSGGCRNRLFEAGLGRADIGNCVRCQNFGFDAQKLGLIPTFAGSFGRIDRLLDGVDGLPVVVSQREGLCPHAEPMIEMVSHADRFSAPQPSSISRSPLVKERSRESRRRKSDGERTVRSGADCHETASDRGFAGKGKCVAAACKEAGTTEHTYYRRRKEYGGLNVDQAKARLAHCCADAAPVAIANVGGASSILIAGCVIW